MLGVIIVMTCTHLTLLMLNSIIRFLVMCVVRVAIMVFMTLLSGGVLLLCGGILSVGLVVFGWQMIKLDYDKPITYEQLEKHKPLDFYADMRRMGLYPVGLPYSDGWNWFINVIKL